MALSRIGYESGCNARYALITARDKPIRSRYFKSYLLRAVNEAELNVMTLFDTRILHERRFPIATRQEVRTKRVFTEARKHALQTFL